MLEMIRNIRLIAGRDAKCMIPTVFLSILDSFLNSGMYCVMILILLELSENKFTVVKLKGYSTALVCIFIVRCVIQALSYTKAQHDGPIISKKLRLSIGNHVRSLNLGFFNQNTQGKLNAVLTTDINDFETILTHCVCDLVKIIAFTILSLFIAISVDWKFGLVIAAIVILALPLLSISGKRSSKNSEKVHTANQNVVSRLVEYITGIKTFRLYNITGNKFKRLDDALKELKKQSINMELSVLPLSLSFSVVTSLLIPASLILGTYLLKVSNIEPMYFIAVLLISVSLSSMMTALSSLFPQVRSLNRAAENIKDVLAQKPFAYHKETIDDLKGSIIFKNVSFGYTKNDTVLNNVSFTAESGTTTALIGPSGSGKTTIVSLLSRFWDVSSGKITVDGINIKDISPDALTSEMAVVFQDVYLLQDTILNNIKVGNPNASMEEVTSAAKAAHCHEFIIKLEKGYDTMVGEGGSTLSGGEKQRISIARALLKDAPIVLLDETTSSLDADNEREIQKAFDTLMKGKTVLVIAHRLNTIVNADNIIVLEKGKIKESGTHNQLIRQNGWYSRMVAEQQLAEQWSVKK
ncbi:ABC transporter ATP-binding protein [Luxibacter massiliensis]|uniref:ABC transporter ATP-binding protein n=1 Tax=Luxibacter massiliensis TaxID=2219695 RepID=UPI000F05030C|nr:ABC transporter ATP-binding protein [Luxibacter massiliensis]